MILSPPAMILLKDRAWISVGEKISISRTAVCRASLRPRASKAAVLGGVEAPSSVAVALRLTRMREGRIGSPLRTFLEPKGRA